MQAQSSQDIQGFQGRQVSRPMGMFHLPSNLEILDPFWDFPQRLLKDWGRTSLFLPISLCTHIQSMPFPISWRPHTPWAPRPTVHRCTSHLRSLMSRGSTVLFIRSSDLPTQLAFSFFLS